MLKVLLTGATGFLGSNLIPHLEHMDLVVLGKKKPARISPANFFEANIGAGLDYTKALTNVDVVIHCAAKTHIMHDNDVDLLQEYRRVNTLGTVNLAQQAVRAGVKRFIFISTIKVNGEYTLPDKLFLPTISNIPTDPYGLSKYEAEIELNKICRNNNMQFVIIRPPLVYGPGVKANFASLLRLASTGLPLPFGCIKHNRRSLVFIDNLVSLIITCIEHPNAGNETFLVSDDEDLSTSEMLRKLMKAFSHAGVLIPVPVSLFKFGCNLLGKEGLFHRLCGSLQLDISKTKKLLNWAPSYSVEQGFAVTAAAYLKSRSTKV